MKQFEVPVSYRSPLISAIKKQRKDTDRMKRDLSPTLLDFGPVHVILARHFGFCYGVENAIEIAFRTVDQNPGKRIYLLSEMIHNPQVNADLRAHGVQFMQDTYGKQLISFDTLTKDDIVIIPAFGTTLELEKKLKDIGIHTELYNTTCPFVEKVWNRSAAIASENYTIVIHGKPKHEETRATFSHSAAKAPSIVVKDMTEAVMLAQYIKGEKPMSDFFMDFEGRYSAGFDPVRHLQRIGVVNQTTMLAEETQAIADFLKQVMVEKYDLTEQNLEKHFADTRDTLCYATNDNQSAVKSMLETPADLAIVVGGYNSSNTSHLVELAEEKLPSYFIKDESNILSNTQIKHYDLHDKAEHITSDWIPPHTPVRILLTSGASCPDAVVERVIERILELFPDSSRIDSLQLQFS